MLCTRCGTQVEEGKNFCRSCGASLAESAPEAGSTETPEPREGTQSLPISLARERRESRRLVFTAAGVALLIAIGAAVYLGSGLFGDKAKPESAPSTGETMADLGKSPEAPEMPKLELSKSGEPSVEGDLRLAAESKAEAPPSKATQSPSSSGQSSIDRARKQSSAPAARKAESRPAPSAGRTPEPAMKRVTPAAMPGTYQTVRPTRIYEQPSVASKVVASIDDGVRVNVVGSAGEWLEVRSRTGNPPGFIRREDALLLE